MATKSKPSLDGLEHPRIEMVYIGKRMTNDGKLADCWRVINPMTKTMDPTPSIWKRVTGHTPGSVWSVEVKSMAETGTIYPKTLRYEREWEDRKQALAWQVEERGVVAARDHKAGVKRALAAQDELEQLLSKLEKAVSVLPRTQRAAIAAEVVARLTAITF